MQGRADGGRQHEKGAVATVEVVEFVGKPGKYPAVGVGYVAGDSAKGDLTMTGSEPDATSVALDQWDGKSFVAVIKGKGGSDNEANGSLRGEVCPPE